MTVCVAAICDNDKIIGASDRMLTSGNIEFEPQLTKIISITNSITAMIAGDTFIQDEILLKVFSEVNKRLKAEPNNWLNVKDIAELYSHYCHEACVKRAEKNILTPLGLDSNTFISRQKEMDPGLIRQLANELRNFEIPTIAAIFAGVDSSGPNIYVVDKEDVSCRNLVGFAAIGIGAGHANSQMMFASHTRRKSFPETLLLVYSAKKRAEVAPGVGSVTDMFMIGPALGSKISINSKTLGVLEKIYNEEQERERKASLKAKNSVDKYIKSLLKKAVVAAEKAIAQKTLTQKVVASRNQRTILPKSGENLPTDKN